MKDHKIVQGNGYEIEIKCECGIKFSTDMDSKNFQCPSCGKDHTSEAEQFVAYLKDNCY